MRKLTPKKAEKEIMCIVKAGLKIPKVKKVEKYAMDKFTGKKNPPRLMTYGEFVDLVQERKGRLREELVRRR